ncbi:class I SAM-dependent methyltransferase [Pendulispora rubella]|uniref:Class I SAM-dependent methyltransferase n=1 Tax=Pendulispora rubella TaxID=2741070 RepID=A0ABZ2KZG3_9BACT|nr:SrbG [Sorangiineae bacterium]
MIIDFSALLAAWCRTLDPPAVRMAILSSPDGFGGIAVRAAEGCGLEVRREPLPLRPARALAFLERTRPDCAVLPVALLREVLACEALALSDLSTLRCIFYEGTAGAMLDAAEVAAAQRLLGAEVSAFVVDGEPAAPIVPQGEAAALAEAKALLEQDVAGLDFTEAIRALEALSHTALRSMLHGLSRSGLFSTPEALHTEDDVVRTANVADAHRPLIRRWLRVLTEQGLLLRSDDAFRSTVPPAAYTGDALDHAWTELETEWTLTMGSSGTIAYARRNAEQLPELLRGTRKAVHLLFPEGRTDLARALYRESIAARYQHHAVRALVGRVAAHAPRPLRILEVGAGTGATSELLLPALAGRDVEYLYTDVSAFFLNEAAERLRAYPFVRFGRYDIDLPPRAQGFAPHEFDVVIGGGVLNAARDTDASIRGLTQLLRTDGWLVLTEPTREEFWVLASQAFMLGETSDGRASTDTTFLSLPQWNAVLDRAGLRRVLGLPEEGHPLHRLGHRVFVARPKQ